MLPSLPLPISARQRYQTTAPPGALKTARAGTAARRVKKTAAEPPLMGVFPAGRSVRLPRSAPASQPDIVQAPSRSVQCVRYQVSVNRAAVGVGRWIVRLVCGTVGLRTFDQAARPSP
ncbi:MAG TPA: hypothetical protein VE201_09315 [Nitrospirales bacterium]|nr:hypothetical protein [Nitrospirales bacterium]